MQNNDYQAKHRRGSSPAPREIERGFDDCPPDRTEEEFELVVRTGVRGLCSIEQVTQDLQQGDQRRELTPQESGPRQQSDDDARWQDDGGES